MRIFLVSLLLVCLSCKSQKKGNQNNEEKVQMEKPILVMEDSYSNIDSSQISIITDQKALQKFFVQVNKTRKPGLPVPEVDFSKEMLILICAGEQQGTYEPNVTILESDDENLTINVERKLPSDSLETAISTPFFLYKMPISEKKVTIRKQ
ncbi:hypothetical protein SB49_02335 [Sediminicola sp. YIK13]|nr:hypothetical protein SB49_02335 [Sediminicola sp. YIK13]